MCEDLRNADVIYFIMIENGYYKFGITGKLYQRMKTHRRVLKFTSIIKIFVCKSRNSAFRIEQKFKKYAKTIGILVKRYSQTEIIHTFEPQKYVDWFANEVMMENNLAARQNGSVSMLNAPKISLLTDDRLIAGDIIEKLQSTSFDGKIRDCTITLFVPKISISECSNYGYKNLNYNADYCRFCCAFIGRNSHEDPHLQSCATKRRWDILVPAGEYFTQRSDDNNSTNKGNMVRIEEQIEFLHTEVLLYRKILKKKEFELCAKLQDLETLFRANVNGL